MAVVKLQGLTKNVLTVTGLDALNGTPILDIKPYLPGDSVANINVPDWVHKLRQSE
jgi:tRNA (Thr-GGU) A37 N-methylase